MKMKRNIKRTIIALTICALALTGCAHKIVTSQEDLPTAGYEPAFLRVADKEGPTIVERIAADVEQREAERKAAEEQAAAEAAAAEEAAYWEAYYAESHSPSGDGFQQEGVRDYNGRTETWYSSRAAYHYRTGEWSVDDEGYYRDDQGRYVVAASDVPEGSEIETSKGTGIVLDSGCDDGVTDFYVSW